MCARVHTLLGFVSANRWNVTSKVSHNEICTQTRRYSTHIECKRTHIAHMSKALVRALIGFVWVRNVYSPGKLEGNAEQLGCVGKSLPINAALLGISLYQKLKAQLWRMFFPPGGVRNFFRIIASSNKHCISTRVICRTNFNAPFVLGENRNG